MAAMHRVNMPISRSPPPTPRTSRTPVGFALQQTYPRSTGVDNFMQDEALQRQVVGGLQSIAPDNLSLESLSALPTCPQTPTSSPRKKLTKSPRRGGESDDSFFQQLKAQKSLPEMRKSTHKASKPGGLTTADISISAPTNFVKHKTTLTNLQAAGNFSTDVNPRFDFGEVAAEAKASQGSALKAQKSYSAMNFSSVSKAESRREVLTKYPSDDLQITSPPPRPSQSFSSDFRKLRRGRGESNPTKTGDDSSAATAASNEATEGARRIISKINALKSNILHKHQSKRENERVAAQIMSSNAETEDAAFVLEREQRRARQERSIEASPKLRDVLEGYQPRSPSDGTRSRNTQRAADPPLTARRDPARDQEITSWFGLENELDVQKLAYNERTPASNIYRVSEKRRYSMPPSSNGNSPTEHDAERGDDSVKDTEPTAAQAIEHSTSSEVTASYIDVPVPRSIISGLGIFGSQTLEKPPSKGDRLPRTSSLNKNLSLRSPPPPPPPPVPPMPTSSPLSQHSVTRLPPSSYRFAESERATTKSPEQGSARSAASSVPSSVPSTPEFKPALTNQISEPYDRTGKGYSIFMNPLGQNPVSTPRVVPATPNPPPVPPLPALPPPPAPPRIRSIGTQTSDEEATEKDESIVQNEIAATLKAYHEHATRSISKSLSHTLHEHNRRLRETVIREVHRNVTEMLRDSHRQVIDFIWEQQSRAFLEFARAHDLNIGKEDVSVSEYDDDA